MPPNKPKQSVSVNKNKHVQFRIPIDHKTPQKNIVIHHKKSILLTQSVQDLPFRNHLIKKNLISHTSHKSISKF